MDQVHVAGISLAQSTCGMKKTLIALKVWSRLGAVALVLYTFMTLDQGVEIQKDVCGFIGCINDDVCMDQVHVAGLNLAQKKKTTSIALKAWSSTVGAVLYSKEKV